MPGNEEENDDELETEEEEDETEEEEDEEEFRRQDLEPEETDAVPDHPMPITDPPRRPRGRPAGSKSFNGQPHVVRGNNRRAGNKYGQKDWPKDCGPLWNTLIAWASTPEDKGGGGNITLDKFAIHIFRVGVGAAPGQATRMTPPINGSNVAGSEWQTPGEELEEMIIASYHMPIAKGPTNYRIKFTRIDNGDLIKIGELNLPGPEEIKKMRSAADAFQESRGRSRSHDYDAYEPVGPPRRPGPPRRDYEPAPAPPPAYAPTRAERDPEVAALLREMREAKDRENAHLRAQVDELMTAMREGRQPNTIQQPAAPPPEPQRLPTADEIAAALERRASERQQQVQQGAQQGRQDAVTVTSGIGAIITGAQEIVKAKKALDKMFGELVGGHPGEAFATAAGAVANGIGGQHVVDVGDETDGEPVPEVAAQVVKPEEQMPWTGIETGRKWPGTDLPMVYPKTRDGSIGTWLMGFAFDNPIVFDKLGPAIEPISRVVANMMENGQGIAQVVGSTPSGAQDANPREEDPPQANGSKKVAW